MWDSDTRSVFYSYAPEDEAFRERLEKHLSLLRRQKIISDWHNRLVVPGNDWSQEITEHLNKSDLILLLVSTDFLASDYCYGVEMLRVLELRDAGLAQVIPILIRPVDLELSLFAHLQALPRNGKPVTIWNDQDEAFVDIVQGIRQTLKAIRYLPPSEQNNIQQIIPFSSEEQSARLWLLEQVQRIWINGMLEDSLHGAMLLALGLQYQPKAVANPWRFLVQETDGTSSLVEVGTHITQIYDKAGGHLLLLGQPGTGKTTLLLELARDLLHRAAQDSLQPLPVVFHLASWTQKRCSFVTWLVDELYERYKVPRFVARQLIGNERLLLLLDGFDEIETVYRSACITVSCNNKSSVPMWKVCCCVVEQRVLRHRSKQLSGSPGLQSN